MRAPLYSCVFAAAWLFSGLDLRADEKFFHPNHLEPVPAYDPEGYAQAVYRSLIGDAPAELWMIGSSGFSPESAVVMRHHAEYSDDDFLAIDPISEKWTVETVQAKKQIWRWKEFPGGKTVLDAKVTKDVIRKEVTITEEFAKLMLSAWSSVLKKTRYAEKDYRGVDGVTFQFYCHYNYFGEIWSPSGGLPALITDLGNNLGKLAEAPKDQRKAWIEKCEALAREIVAKSKLTEQGGARQPATAPDSKSEGNEKPKPESEGRSQ